MLCLRIEDSAMFNNPDQVALMFLSNFTNLQPEELAELDITRALSELLCQIVQETVEVMGEKEERVLH
tara:strand:- start:371 stop:574 length:204 start_codon:yes stop_codon:yes gene_type:complete